MGDLQLLPINYFLYMLDFLHNECITSNSRRKRVLVTQFCGTSLTSIPSLLPWTRVHWLLQKLRLLPVPLGTTPPPNSTIYTT